MKYLLRLGALLAIAPAATAQIDLIAFESFDYASPGLLHDQGGGTGWANNWWAGGGANDDVVIFNSSISPAFAGADGIGNYAGQASVFGVATRSPDLTPHPDIVDPADGMIGADGATIWVSFSTVNFQGMPLEHYGGLSLQVLFGAEKLFIGSPWNSNAWGIDDEGDQGNPAELIAGTDDTVATRIVVRIDHLAGMERLRMWTNPSVPHPTGSADLDTMIADLRWNEIRISSGGNNGDLYYWDEIVIEKGKPEIGAALCSPAVANSTGGPAFLYGYGSEVADDNQVCLVVCDLPDASSGYFVNSQETNFVANPGGSDGDLCIASFSQGRHDGNVLTSAGGKASLAIDLTMLPQPGGPVSAVSGETWYFQYWYRDTDSQGRPVSNFSDAICIPLQ